MQPGGLVGGIDVAQILLNLFVLFFIGLVLHLRQGEKREGYPLTEPGGPRGCGKDFRPSPNPRRSG